MQKNNDIYDDLGDGLLGNISYSWKTNELKINTTQCGKPGEVQLIFKNVQDISIPHLENWGRSNCILKFSFSQTGESITATFQMQSGDVIIIKSATIELPREMFERPKSGRDEVQA